MALIKPHMAHRLDNASKLINSAKVDNAFPGRRTAIHPQVDPQPRRCKKRCAMCIEEVRDKGYSAKRSKLNRVAHRCCKSDIPLCAKYMSKLCLSCNGM